MTTNNLPTDAEIIEWATQEQFFLFCDEDELLDIVKSTLQRFGQPAEPVKVPSVPDPIANSIQNARQSVDYWRTKCRHMAELMVAEAETLSGIEGVAVDYLRPDGITRREAMTRIIELVDSPESEEIGCASPNPSDTLRDLLDEAYAELLADSHRDGPRCLLLTRIEAALAAPVAAQPSVPEGYAIVPIEPTQEMKDAAMAILLYHGDIYQNEYDQIVVETITPRHLLKAMIDAAPTPPADGHP